MRPRTSNCQLLSTMSPETVCGNHAERVQGWRRPRHPVASGSRVPVEARMPVTYSNYNRLHRDPELSLLVRTWIARVLAGPDTVLRF